MHVFIFSYPCASNPWKIVYSRKYFIYQELSMEETKMVGPCVSIMDRWGGCGIEPCVSKCHIKNPSWLSLLEFVNVIRKWLRMQLINLMSMGRVYKFLWMIMGLVYLNRKSLLLMVFHFPSSPFYFWRTKDEFFI